MTMQKGGLSVGTRAWKYPRSTHSFAHLGSTSCGSYSGRQIDGRRGLVHHDRSLRDAQPTPGAALTGSIPGGLEGNAVRDARLPVP